MTKLLCVFASLVAAACAAPAQAQAPYAAAAHAHARITASAPDAMLARALRSTRTDLSGAVTQPTSTTTTFLTEQARVRRSSTTAIVVGSVIGLAAGAAVGCKINSDDYGVFCGGQSDTTVVVSALIGGAVGGVVGALVSRRAQGP